jgi:two-component system LytT family response regulator
MSAHEKKMRALIVDDEPLARRNLTLLLGRDPDIEIVAECHSGKEAIETIRRLRPDIVFLDVQMPEYDGFDVLELLGGDQPPAVVFVTAHDEHALRAFEAGALDYLMKPFTRTRFERALSRAKERLAHRVKHWSPPADRLIVKSAGRVLFINITDIDWIEAANYYACLHVGANTHILRRSLSILARELQHGPLCRIHRSTIVNLDRVRGLDRMEDGEYEVLLQSGVRLRTGRRFRGLLVERLRSSGQLADVPGEESG